MTLTIPGVDAAPSPLAVWREAHKFSPSVVRLADRHYSRQTPGSPQCCRPGVNLVLVLDDGTAARAEIRTSSGFERLDQAALQTVLRWRYVPGKRGGTPEAMWVTVPINFVLE